MGEMNPPVNISSLVTLINHFVNQSIEFLSTFSHRCESKLAQISKDVERLESSLLILEKKLNSIEPPEPCPLTTIPEFSYFFYLPEFGDDGDIPLNLDFLPDEVLSKIISYLNVSDILKLRLCSQHLNSICLDETLWQQICQKFKIGNRKILDKTWRQCYLEHCSLLKYQKREITLFQKAWVEFNKLKPKKNNQEGNNSEENTKEQKKYNRKSLLPFFNKFSRVDLMNESKRFIEFQRKAAKYFIKNFDKIKENNMSLPEIIALNFKDTEWNEEFFRVSLIRYQLFLTLQAKYRDCLLIPTLCIEFIWQCHLFHWDSYKKDCEQLFGRVIDHQIYLSPVQTLSRTDAIKQTSFLWEKEYHAPYGIDLNTLPENFNVVHNIFSKFSGEKPTEFLEYLTLPAYYDLPWSDRFIKNGTNNNNNAPTTTNQPKRSKNKKNCNNTTMNPQTPQSNHSNNNYSLMLSLSTKDILEFCEWIGCYEFAMTTVPDEPLHKETILELLSHYYRKIIKISKQTALTKQVTSSYPIKGVDLIWRTHQLFPLHYINDWEKFSSMPLSHVPWPTPTVPYSIPVNKLENLIRKEFQYLLQFVN